MPIGASSARVLDVTPGLAVLWTHKTTLMRNPSKRSVGFFAQTMKAGKWELNGYSLKFNREGLLIDGLHRLLAVIKSGATVKMLCIFGLNLEEHDVRDSREHWTGK